MARKEYTLFLTRNESTCIILATDVPHHSWDEQAPLLPKNRCLRVTREPLIAYSESGCYKRAGQYVSIMRNIECMTGLI